MNDPYLKTIGVGTRIFLGGAQGYVTWTGTQHKKDVERGLNGVPLTPAGTLSVTGDLKEMSPEWLVGQIIRGYGCSLSVGLGIPIPISPDLLFFEDPRHHHQPNKHAMHEYLRWHHL